MTEHSVDYSMVNIFDRYFLYVPKKRTKVSSPCKCVGCMPVNLSKVLKKVEEIAFRVGIEMGRNSKAKKLLWVVKVERWDVPVGTFRVGWQTLTSMESFVFCITVGLIGKGQLENLQKKKPEGKYYRFFGRSKLFFPKVHSSDTRKVVDHITSLFLK